MKARAAIRVAHVAAVATGIALGLLGFRRPAEAAIAAAFAVLLIILALLWQLRQEDKRP